MTSTRDAITPSPEIVDYLTLDQFHDLHHDNKNPWALYKPTMSPFFDDPETVFPFLKKLLNVSPTTLNYLKKKLSSGEIGVVMYSEDPKYITSDGKVLEWDFLSSPYSNFSFFVEKRPESKFYSGPDDEENAHAHEFKDKFIFARIDRNTGKLDLTMDILQEVYTAGSVDFGNITIKDDNISNVWSILSDAPSDLFNKASTYELSRYRK